MTTAPALHLRPPLRHVLVAGAGVAGVSAAWALAEAGVRVTLVDEDRPGATALASLVNPFTGPKASPAWRWEEALDALDALLDAAGTRLRPGLVRPGRDARQATAFAARAAAHPHALAWHDDAPPPGFAAPHGWLDVRVGGVWADPAADLAWVVERLVAAGAVERVPGRAVDAGDAPGGAWLDVGTDPADGGGAVHRLTADDVVLALGDGLRSFAALGALGLTRVGGRRYTAALGDAVPAVSVGAYAVPLGDGRAHVGGTYDHDDPDAGPTPEEGAALIGRLGPFVPSLGTLVGAGEAAVRVHRAGARRPLVRRVPDEHERGRERVWALTGLGSKGLLAAPLVARGLPAWLRGAPVPDDVS